jgi:hypothetical protein
MRVPRSIRSFVVGSVIAFDVIAFGILLYPTPFRKRILAFRQNQGIFPMNGTFVHLTGNATDLDSAKLDVS